MKKGNVLLLIVLIALLSAGCASRSAYITTRHDPDAAVDGAKTVAIMPHDQPILEEQGLNASLKTALEQNGFRIVPATESAYTIGYWMEDDWHERALSPEAQAAPPPSRDDYMAAGGNSGTQEAYDSLATFKARQREIQRQNPYLLARGIRLKLYRTADLQAGRFHTVWEGCIDAGYKVRAERQEVLLKALLRYLGQDFDGRAAL